MLLVYDREHNLKSHSQTCMSRANVYIIKKDIFKPYMLRPNVYISEKKMFVTSKRVMSQETVNLQNSNI